MIYLARLGYSKPLLKNAAPFSVVRSIVRAGSAYGLTVYAKLLLPGIGYLLELEGLYAKARAV